MRNIELKRCYVDDCQIVSYLWIAIHSSSEAAPFASTLVVVSKRCDWEMILLITRLLLIADEFLSSHYDKVH